METLSNLFYSAASAFPDKEAIWCDGNTKSYKELESMVNRYSHFLMDCGIKYKEHIGIPMNNSIEAVALMFTAANLGVALVPINPTLSADAINKAFTYGDVKHVIARKAFFEQMDRSGNVEISGAKICMDAEYEGTVSLQEADKFENTRPIVGDVTGQESFILTMTSGSTGSPKPIDLTQENKYKRAMAHIRMYQITKEDRILAATPLYHSLAERLVLIPLLIGGTSVLLPRFTPSIWLNCVKNQNVTFTIAVSAQLSQIADLLSSPLAPEIDSLRCVVSSSALLEPHVKNALIDKLKCDFHEMYGTSETSTVTDINFKETLQKKKSVGKAIEEADIRILSDDGMPLEIGKIGEIACRTELLCGGYYNMPQMFSAALSEGYFRTGDLGYLDEDGFLFFSGRKKELIITGGINVYPPDVEACVSQMEEVSECAAFAYPDERLGEVVAIAIVLKEGCSLRKRTVQIHCARNLADFQQPHEIFLVKDLPKNAMGKLVKGALVEYVAKEQIAFE